MIINKRKRIKWNNKLWLVNISTYDNKRMCLSLKNKKNIIEVTINLKDAYLDKYHIFLDPDIKDNGLLKVLKKSRIIKNVIGMSYYDYVSVPIAIVNTGILKSYDYNGMNNYLTMLGMEE